MSALARIEPDRRIRIDPLSARPDGGPVLLSIPVLEEGIVAFDQIDWPDDAPLSQMVSATLEFIQIGGELVVCLVASVDTGVPLEMATGSKIDQWTIGVVIDPIGTFRGRLGEANLLRLRLHLTGCDADVYDLSAAALGATINALA